MCLDSCAICSCCTGIREQTTDSSTLFDAEKLVLEEIAISERSDAYNMLVEIEQSVLTIFGIAKVDTSCRFLG